MMVWGRINLKIALLKVEIVGISIMVETEIYISEEKLRVLITAFVIPQFSYCPPYMDVSQQET